jgi:hypothetical protein
MLSIRMGIELCVLQLSDCYLCDQHTSLLKTDNFLHVIEKSENVLSYVI